MFHSKYADRIWNKLYRVNIPDQMTLPGEYVKRFGVHVTGNKQVDEMLSRNTTQVMIPISTIINYFQNGVEIQIPNREDMITMHKDMELYLEEWKEHIKYDINLDIAKNRDMLMSLEKLSKYIYNKAKPREVIDQLFQVKSIGIVNPLQALQQQKKEVIKPEYDGIKNLLNNRNKPTKAPGGRFN